VARRTTWRDSLFNFSIAVGAQAVIEYNSGATQDENRGSTLTRTIAEFGLISQTVAGAWGISIIDIGVALIEADALAVAVVPDPAVDRDEPGRGWIYRTRCVVAQNGIGTQIIYKCMFDMAGQRKIDSQRFALIIDHTASLGTAFNVQLIGIIRSLVLLP